MNSTALRTYLGYEALIRSFELKVPPLRRVYIATDRATEVHATDAEGNERIELPGSRIADTESIVGHLTFALKREDLNLTVLAALFDLPDVIDELRIWLREKPSSKYARMVGHLAEWLTDFEFDFRLPPGAPRVPLLDPKRYVVGPAISDPKFGIINNLVGDRWFCPLVRRTDRLNTLLAEGLAAKVNDAMNSIEPEMFSRAVGCAISRTSFHLHRTSSGR